MILIRQANIWTMAGKNYEPGDILIDGTKIVQVAENIDEPPGTQLIDASGTIAMPGMIDAHCHLGMREEGLGFEGTDGNEMVNPVTANLRAIDGINPANVIFRDSYEAGITTICTGPGSANVVGGTYCLMKTYGSRVDDMIIKDPFALKVAFGENPKRVYGRTLNRAPYTRMGSVALLRQHFFQAGDYQRKQERAAGDPLKAPAYDAVLEVFARVLSKEIPLVAHAHRADDIFSAIRVAKEFGVDLILIHCTEGYLITDELLAENYPIIFGPLMLKRYKVEMMGLSYDAPAIMSRAGLKFAFCTDAPVIPGRLLPVAIGYSVSKGMDEQEALKSITIYPAQVLGIADRVGSIEAGKDADLVLYDGHPFDLLSKIRTVLIDGRIVYQNGIEKAEKEF